MSIQILSLREYKDKDGKSKLTDSYHYSELWRAPNIIDLFANIENYVDKIPAHERYNMFYTVSECEEAKRVFLRQTVIPFDMDGIDTKNLDQYITIFCNNLQVEKEKIAIVMTGHGLQFLVGTNKEIENGSYFEENKPHYIAICRKINKEMAQANLKGNMDTTCFSVARLFRLPLTKNDKSYKGLPIVDTALINRTIEPYELDFFALSGLPKIEPTDQMHKTVYDALPYIDTRGVQEGCGFLKYCKDSADKVSEPQWYAMLSIIGRLHAGRELAHEYSKGHANYDEFETEEKLDQALCASGPRTCINISGMWDGCFKCEHWQKINSPITIRGEHFIASQNDGFWIVERIRGTDAKKYIRPNYADLMKFYDICHPFKSLTKASVVWTWRDGKWSDNSKLDIYSFVEKNLSPKPSNTICKEFEGKILRNHVVDADFFEVKGRINMRNGVLDLETRKLSPPSPEYGFTYKLPFPYEERADCPRFKQFLHEIFEGKQDLIDLLIEFMGCTLAGVPSEEIQKAIVLYGDGNNGKSVLVDTLCYLVGEGNFSALKMGDEINKIENRYQLAGKLFNLSEEVPENAFRDSSIFKDLVTGGRVQIRKYYHDAYYIKNNAKIWMLCNSLPDTIDNSVGMYRRLIIIPFRRQFSVEDGTADIKLREKLYAESSGIFNYCLQGLDRFLKNGRFTESENVRQALEEYRETTDCHSEWIKNNIVISKDARNKLTNVKIHMAYSFQMKQLDIKPLNSNFLMRKLRKIIPKDKFKRCNNVKFIEGYDLIDQEGVKDDF